MYMSPELSVRVSLKPDALKYFPDYVCKQDFPPNLTVVGVLGNSLADWAQFHIHIIYTVYRKKNFHACHKTCVTLNSYSRLREFIGADSVV